MVKGFETYYTSHINSCSQHHFFDSIRSNAFVSGFILFLPFFVVGYKMRGVKITIFRRMNRTIAILGIIGTFVLMGLMVYICRLDFRGSWFYWTYSFKLHNLKYIFVDIMKYMLALVMCICFIACAKDKNTVFTQVGRNSIVVYLLHGFCLPVVSSITSFVNNEIYEFIISICISLVLSFVLSRKWIADIYIKVFEGIEKLIF